MTPGALEGMEHEKQHQARHGGDQREARRHPGTFQIRIYFTTGCTGVILKHLFWVDPTMQIYAVMAILREFPV